MMQIISGEAFASTVVSAVSNGSGIAFKLIVGDVVFTRIAFIAGK
jgi:hypothetical protein